MAERDFNLEMTGEQVKDALQQLEDRVAEGWAVGEHDGVPVTSGSPYFENNSKWWAQQAGLSATAAASSAATAEQEVEEGIRQGIVGTYVQESATPGAIVTIDDGADDVPLKDLKVNLDINQPGTGDPSPTNVRPIYPVTEAEVSRVGVNQWDEQWELGKYDTSTGEKSNSSTQIRNKNKIRVLSGQQYYIKKPAGQGNMTVCNYAEDGSFIDGAEIIGGASGGGVYTIPASVAYITFFMGNGYGTAYNNNLSFNYPATDTDYHAYAGQQHLVNIGIQQWDEDWEVGTINNDTGLPDTDANNIRSKNFCPCIAGAQYNIVSKDSKVLRYYFYDKDETFISGGATSGTNTIVTAPTGACYFKVRTTSSYGSTYLSDISVNFPARFTEYHAYTGNVVYGGELDVTAGVLTARYKMQIFDGTENWRFDSYNTVNRGGLSLADAPIGQATNDLALSYMGLYTPPTYSQPDPWTAVINVNGYLLVGLPTTITSLEEWKAYLASNPLEVVYPLATPISIQLTPTEVDTLRGQNVIFADCGDITNCEYRADLKMYIDKVVGA